MLFEPDQRVLLPGAGPVLAALDRKLRYTYPHATANIAGYTAAAGTGDGMALSRDRAQVMANWLEANGVIVSRLTVQGFGDTRQIPGGLAVNRRVVVTLNVG